MSKRILDRVAVCVGMPRSGTTWLYQNLKSHPQISVTNPKETLHYLHSSDYEGLLSYFGDSTSKYLIDINPIYFLDLEAIERVSHYHERVILIRRGTEEWRKSIIAQTERYGTKSNLERMLFPFPRGDGTEIILDLNTFEPELQIQKIQEILGERLIILEFEKLKEDPVGLLNSVERHIGCDEYFTPDNIHNRKINSRDHKIPVLLRILYRLNLIQPLGRVARVILPERFYNYLLKKYWYGG